MFSLNSNMMISLQVEKIYSYVPDVFDVDMTGVTIFFYYYYYFTFYWLIKNGIFIIKSKQFFLINDFSSLQASQHCGVCCSLNLLMVSVFF